MMASFTSRPESYLLKRMDKRRHFSWFFESLSDDTFSGESGGVYEPIECLWIWIAGRMTQTRMILPNFLPLFDAVISSSGVVLHKHRNMAGFHRGIWSRVTMNRDILFLDLIKAMLFNKLFAFLCNSRELKFLGVLNVMSFFLIKKWFCDTCFIHRTSNEHIGNNKGI